MRLLLFIESYECVELVGDCPGSATGPEEQTEIEETAVSAWLL